MTNVRYVQYYYVSYTELQFFFKSWSTNTKLRGNLEGTIFMKTIIMQMSQGYLGRGRRRRPLCLGLVPFCRPSSGSKSRPRPWPAPLMAGAPAPRAGAISRPRPRPLACCSTPRPRPLGLTALLIAIIGAAALQAGHCEHTVLYKVSELKK
jgi:hypothetical protein